mmetsp:Transcript_794/g.1723  ORF Transcript_794/g.1723 Transcript_794/m.1723 type:complete len:229 (-) Transcript_794:95-781(-)
MPCCLSLFSKTMRASRWRSASSSVTLFLQSYSSCLIRSSSPSHSLFSCFKSSYRASESRRYCFWVSSSCSASARSSWVFSRLAATSSIFSFISTVLVTMSSIIFARKLHAGFLHGLGGLITLPSASRSILLFRGTSGLCRPGQSLMTNCTSSILMWVRAEYGGCSFSTSSGPLSPLLVLFFCSLSCRFKSISIGILLQRPSFFVVACDAPERLPAEKPLMTQVTLGRV